MLVSHDTPHVVFDESSRLLLCVSFYSMLQHRLSTYVLTCDKAALDRKLQFGCVQPNEAQL